MTLPHDPPQKLERAIVALARAWQVQALLGQAHIARSPERKRQLDPVWHATWTELGNALDDLQLWQAVYYREVRR